MTTPLEERIKQNLDNSAQHLDSATIQRLQSIRRKALNQSGRRLAAFWQPAYWAPVAGLAFCSLLVILLFLPQSETITPAASANQTAMLELLDDAETLDVITDPGFYLWMEELESQNV